MGAIAKYFEDNLKNEFDVISCKECGLLPQWPNSDVFAIWLPGNRERLLNYFECIHKKLKQTDIFIFQDLRGEWAIDKLQTDYLCNEILPKNTIKICLPNFRFLTHANDHICLRPWIEYAKTRASNSREIIDFLQNSDDPHLIELFQNEMPYNKEYVQNRNENYSRYENEIKKYDICINMNNWVEENFEKHLLAYSHNHPTEIYYRAIIPKIFNYINIDEVKFPIKKNIFHATSESLDPEQFNFFRTQFPNMNYSEITRRQIRDRDINRLK